MTEKAADAYRTISEVAEAMDVPQHVLRFWETRFSQIKPLKRGGGRRYYRVDDVDLLKGIRHLLYAEGFTIRGVQRILKEQGAKAVIAIGRTAPNTMAELNARQAEEPVAMPLPASVPITPPAIPPQAAPAVAIPPVAMPAAAMPVAAPRPLAAHGFAAISPDPAPLREEPAEAVGSSVAKMARDDLRRLQATLFELSECRQMLDAALAGNPKTA